MNHKVKLRVNSFQTFLKITTWLTKMFFVVLFRLRSSVHKSRLRRNQLDKNCNQRQQSSHLVVLGSSQFKFDLFFFQICSFLFLYLIFFWLFEKNLIKRRIPFFFEKKDLYLNFNSTIRQVRANTTDSEKWLGRHLCGRSLCRHLPVSWVAQLTIREDKQKGKYAIISRSLFILKNSSVLGSSRSSSLKMVKKKSLLNSFGA